MRYDPENRHYYFSTKQVLEYEERRSIINANTQNALGILRDVVNIHTFDENAGLPKKTVTVISKLIGIAAAIAVLAAVIIPAYIGHTAISVMNFGLTFVAAGLYCMLGKKDRKVRIAGTTLNFRQFGAFLILFGFFIAVPMIFIRRLGTVCAVLIAVGGGFLTAGLMLAADAMKIFRRNGSKYGKTVRAKCIGYVRFVNYSTSGSAPYIMSAEVFEYEYYGEICQAINSVATDQIPTCIVGTHVNIRLSPADPFDVTYHGDDMPNLFSVIVSFLLPFFLCAIGIITFVFAAHLPASMKNIANEETADSGKFQLTDGYVSRIVNDSDNWEIRYLTVLNSYTDENGRFIIEFTDGSKDIRKRESDLAKYPAGSAVILVADGDKIYATYQFDRWNYIGEHTVRDLRDVLPETTTAE